MSEVAMSILATAGADTLLRVVTPLFLSMSLLWLAGTARGLKTGFVGDGGTDITWTQTSFWMPGTL